MHSIMSDMILVNLVLLFGCVLIVLTYNPMLSFLKDT